MMGMAVMLMQVIRAMQLRRTSAVKEVRLRDQVGTARM
jgi:hypothetical protein